MKSSNRRRARGRAVSRPTAPAAPAGETPVAPTAPRGGTSGPESARAGGTDDPAPAAPRQAVPPGYEIVRDDPDPAWAERWFVPAALLILVAAAALRLPELALNPFHHDEGVNGFFTTNLVRNGVYQYDPANYHGPTLYYFAFVSSVLVGLTSEALRLVPVFFGLLTVALVLPLRRLIGPIAALGAAALLAVSPGAVYMSRYFIHEALLVCFSLGLVASALLYLDRRELRYLVTGAAAAALMFATKETGVITVAVLVIAAVVTRLYVDFRTPEGERSAAVPGTARGAVRPKRKPRTIWIESFTTSNAGIRSRP